MRITILSNADLASCVALNHLLPALTGHELSLFLSSSVGRRTQPVARPPALELLRFYEQTLFNEILFPLFDVSHRGRATALLTFNGLATYLQQPLQMLNTINTPEGLAEVSATSPDLILSIRYGVILRDPVLALPAHGVLNLHSGLLPDYKGVMATFRALLQGDSHLGTTLHWIEDSSIDTGRIIGTTRLPVQRDKSYLWHLLALYEAGCALMAETVQRLSEGLPVAATPQAVGGNYFSFPEQAELDAFAVAGWQLVKSTEIERIAKRFMERDKPA